jgi:hypothetical protein
MRRFRSGRSLQVVVLTSVVVCAFVAASVVSLGADKISGSEAESVNLSSPAAVAAEVDRLIHRELERGQSPLADRTSDEDFLRRVSLDLAGTLPKPHEVTLFGLDPDAEKRSKLIDRLVESEEYARTWARYWQDVIFSSATDARSRLAQPIFENWMAEQLESGAGWHEIATALVTATGDVREDGATALMFAHGGMAAELAAETSRIFLGIQMQCANCHDHPTDGWKREQFHELAAFFPRIRVRQRQDVTPRTFEVVSLDVGSGRGRRGPGNAGAPFLNPERLLERLDKNDDGKISREEAQADPNFARMFDRLLPRYDSDRDGALSLRELRRVQPPQLAGRGFGQGEYMMPDLNNPSSRGTPVQPAFFLNDAKPRRASSDQDRRQALARYLTAPDNEWFAKAFVNRMWAELLGQGFYMPIDDIGPERTADFPDVLDLLSRGFVANDYDIRWLLRTIAQTEAYQRTLPPTDASDSMLPFAAASPTRLRADQVYNALTQVLGPDALSGGRGGRGRGPGGGAFGRFGSGLTLFRQIFGFDPSTPQEDITGTVPQALFMMNSPQVNRAIRGFGDTRLSWILNRFDDDDEALAELYLLVLARGPSEAELEICREYIRDVGNRREAFEDVMWSLLNSSEFLTKR